MFVYLPEGRLVGRPEGRPDGLAVGAGDAAGAVAGAGAGARYEVGRAPSQGGGRIGASFDSSAPNS